jgi:hypothetical protein
MNGTTGRQKRKKKGEKQCVIIVHTALKAVNGITHGFLRRENRQKK